MQNEAQILAKYLIGKSISNDLIKRYCDAIDALETDLDEKESKLWQKCLNNPILLPYIDSGLALHDSFSKIRFRIYIMFCILETSSVFADHFLPQKKSFWYIPKFLLEMAIAGCKGAVGFIMIKLFFNVRNI